jgi:hypothetical protein
VKTVNLKRKTMSLAEALKLAAGESLRIVTPDGRAFVLESADSFEQEVELLSRSRKFQRFLRDRFKEPANTSLERYRRSLE